MRHTRFMIVYVSLCLSAGIARSASLDAWTYIQVDDNRQQWGKWDEPSWLRYFGLAMADVTGDGYRDIVAGRYFYGNPGGDMSGEWPQIDLGFNVDGMLFVDVDSDGDLDILQKPFGLADPKVNIDIWLNEGATR